MKAKKVTKLKPLKPKKRKKKKVPELKKEKRKKMTILDIVSRDAFQESSLESGPGGPSGRWHAEHAVNQSTKTNATKRGWSLGGVARGAAIGGLVVGGAAAAVLASNAQSRKELTDRLRAAIKKFLDNGDAASPTGIAHIETSLRDALITLNAQGEMIAEISTRLDNVQVQMDTAKREVAAAQEVRVRTIAEIRASAAEHKRAAKRLQLAKEGVDERSSRLLDAANLQLAKVDNYNDDSTNILSETTRRSMEVAETQRKIESLVTEFTSVYTAQDEAASQLLAKLESATARLQADLQRHEQGSQSNETEESASKDRLQQIEARLTEISDSLAAIVTDTARSTAQVTETTNALTAAARRRPEANSPNSQGGSLDSRSAPIRSQKPESAPAARGGRGIARGKGSGRATFGRVCARRYL